MSFLDILFHHKIDTDETGILNSFYHLEMTSWPLERAFGGINHCRRTSFVYFNYNAQQTAIIYLIDIYFSYLIFWYLCSTFLSQLVWMQLSSPTTQLHCVNAVACFNAQSYYCLLHSTCKSEQFVCFYVMQQSGLVCHLCFFPLVFICVILK